VRPREFGTVALVAALLLSGCEGDRQVHTVAVYEAPLSRCTVRMEARGVVRAVADMSQQSSVVVTWQSASGPAVAGPFSIQAALRQGQVEFGDEPSAKGAWPARGGEVFSRLLSTAGYSPVPEELEELLSATYGVLLGPKGTLMPGQTRALRVVSVTFDR